MALQAKDKPIASAGEPVLRAIEVLLPVASSAEDQIKYPRAIDHLRAAAALTSRDPDPLLWARVHAQLCGVMWRNAAYREGSEIAQEVLRVHEQHLGMEHPDTLSSVGHLAGLLKAKGDLAGAEPLYRGALAGRERVLGAEHPDALGSVGNLAGLRHAHGRLE